MSEASEIPEGVHVPGWFRQYLEARTAAAGPANDPPPLLMQLLSQRSVEILGPWVGRISKEPNHS